jgi:regulator of protease activity HflC (stomatin/prohibitin superfamily)
VHLLNDPLFNFLGTSPATSPHISVASTLHVITVGREELGLCLANAQGHFLGPGRHAICHPRFEFRGLCSAKAEYLCVGSKHRVFLAEGRLGLAWEGGRPLVLEPKEDRTPHCFDSATFAFDRSVPATQQVVMHGSVKVITVRQGFVGVSFRDGALEVMPPGRVVLSSVTHAFSGFLPTGQQTMQLEAVDGMTSDNVGLKFDAAICVQIVDAKKAIMALSTTAESARRANTASSDAGFDSDTIWTAVCAKARLALSIIIGNQRLNRGDGREEEDGAHPPFQPGRGGVPPMALGPSPAEARAHAGADAAKMGDAGDPTPALAPHKPMPSFRTRIHDTCVVVAASSRLPLHLARALTHTLPHSFTSNSFMANFAARMLEDCGVAVVDMSLEDVRITDKTLAEAMARGAVARADLAKATVERQIKMTQSEAEKAAEILRAEGKAAATSVIAVAEANRVKLMDDTFSLLKSPVSQQRETLLAAGEVLRGSNSTLVLAGSPLDAAQMLGGGGGGGGGLSALLARSGAAAVPR